MTQTFLELREPPAHSYGTYQYLPAAGRAYARPQSGIWKLKMEPAVTMRVKRVFGRVQSSRDGAVLINDTIEVTRDLEWLMERWPLLPADDLSARRLAAGAEAHREKEIAVTQILAPQRKPRQLPTEPARPARDYQVTAVELLRVSKSLLLTDDLGLGKTFTGLLNSVHPDALPMLVVPPTHLPSRWLTEAKDSFPWLTIETAKKGTPPKDWKPSDLPDVLIVPYSKLGGWGQHLIGHIRYIVFDEVQDLRTGTDTVKGHAAAMLCDSADYVLGMTASPVYNYGGDMWNIMNILAKGQLGTREEFIREWGNVLANGKISVKDPGALGSYLREQGLMLGRKRHEVGKELPEAISVPHVVESDPAALEAIKGDARELAKLILSNTAQGKDRWRAAGELDWKLREATGIGKAPYVAAFVQMLLESEEKVILAGWHRAVYDIWMSALDQYKPVMYTGSESPAQKDAAQKAFEEGDARVMIMSLRSGAGLDGLQKVCNTTVFGELDWSPKVHDQLIGRTRRDGMVGPAPVAYFLHTLDGSDPAVIEALGVKLQQSEPMLNPDGKMMPTRKQEAGRAAALARQVLGLEQQ